MDGVNINKNHNLTWTTLNKEKMLTIRNLLEQQREEHVKLYEEHKKHADYFSYIISMFKVDDPSKKVSDHLEDYIVQILEKHRIIKLKDLVHFIEEMPITIDTTNLYNLVYSVLRGNDKFEKIERGKWTLKTS